MITLTLKPNLIYLPDCQLTRHPVICDELTALLNSSDMLTILCNGHLFVLSMVRHTSGMSGFVNFLEIL